MAKATPTKPSAKATTAKPAPRVLMKIECAPECGFMTRNHDQDELAKFAAEHAKNQHGRTFTRKDMQGMMRPA